MLQIILVDAGLNRSNPLKDALLNNGFDVIAHVKGDVDLQSTCSELIADVVIIDTDSPSRDMLDNVHTMTQQNTRPIVMFSEDGDKAMVKAATQAGVSAYVVGTITNERLAPVIEAAIARFEETKLLRDELNQANTKLDERKVIERAKGILMRQRDLDEDEAYTLLRSMAMQKNMKLADLSGQLIDAAKMLIV